MCVIVRIGRIIFGVPENRGTIYIDCPPRGFFLKNRARYLRNGGFRKNRPGYRRSKRQIGPGYGYAHPGSGAINPRWHGSVPCLGTAHCHDVPCRRSSLLLDESMPDGWPSRSRLSRGYGTRASGDPCYGLTGDRRCQSNGGRRSSPPHSRRRMPHGVHRRVPRGNAPCAPPAKAPPKISPRKKPEQPQKNPNPPESAQTPPAPLPKPVPHIRRHRRRVVAELIPKYIVELFLEHKLMDGFC